MTGKVRRIIAQNDWARLDKFLADSVGALSRSRARALVEQGMVTLDGRHVRPTHRVSRGQEIVLTIPPESREELQPEDRPVSFVHVDEFIAVVNKPPGVVVHPAAGNRSGTLVNALLFHLGALPAEGQEDRPGIVHRLDKGTSGLLVVARTPEALHFLQLEFAQRRVQKEYLAITAGVPRGHSGTVTAAIGRDETKRKKMAVKAYGGRKAVTRYEVIEDFSTHALVRLAPLTGRTHQIRVHLRSLGTPVLCDSTYSRKSVVRASELLGAKKEKGEEPVLARQALHAHRLSFEHPKSGQRVSFEAPLPADMQNVLEILRSRCKRQL
jgi:23S rRNA pseudouridine1911/1915/1917 synthase